MKRNIIIGIASIIIFFVGFVLGMEYKSYQIASAISDAFTLDENVDSTTGLFDTEPEEPLTIITKSLGEDVELATITVKVNSVDERQTLNARYGSPAVASENAKFLVISMDVTNTTDSEFYFSPDFVLKDEKGRKFSYYDDTIGSIDDYLNGDLSPSIKKTGRLVYEVPSDATEFSLIAQKAGTNEVYEISITQ